MGNQDLSIIFSHVNSIMNSVCFIVELHWEFSEAVHVISCASAFSEIQWHTADFPVTKRGRHKYTKDWEQNSYYFIIILNIQYNK